MAQGVASVVIGANFGDEGKGLITDFETRRLGAGTVVRFNGGAQAGHTVISRLTGQRHVFGHVGAGTFAGANTYLSSNFIVNPMVLEKELTTLGQTPNINVHPFAKVTTIFDMALNSLVELSRGNERHGSCGMGINETVTRHEFYPLTVGAVLQPSFTTRQMIAAIRDEWVPNRIKALGIKDIPKAYAKILKSNTHEVATNLFDSLQRCVISKPAHDTLGKKPVVFEGAQGLMLDEFLGVFPHVTRSITGLPYALQAAAEIGIKRIKPIYVTRAYLTRHGAGALPNQGYDFGGQPTDPTNIDNAWQGSIRFAPLEIDQLKNFIDADLLRSKFVSQVFGITVEQPTIAVTCLDQIDNLVTVVQGNKFTKMQINELPKFLESSLGLKVSHISRGPNSGDVEYVNF